MIFDIKLGDNFQHKARMVAGDHTTKTPILGHLQFRGIEKFGKNYAYSSGIEWP